MKATLKGLLGSSSGSGSSSNDSPVSKVDEVSNMSSEATSYGADAELELGLGLSIGGRTSSDAGKPKVSTCGRILTAKDFPSVVSRNVSGTKRAADSVSQESGSSPPRVSQVVGWPPIRASRMYSLLNQAKTPRSEDEKVVEGNKEKSQDIALKKKTNNGGNTNVVVKEQGNLGFVKVNVDGMAIGRKVDLNAHSCYETLAQTLQDMFFRTGMTLNLNGSGGEKEQAAKPSKLLEGSSEFVLTYEDKDGDWMLVGDVPWRMFLSSVKRLRIMRTSEANGLAPRFQERNERQRIKPI
ncbi:hypothetical protein TIFTF001_022455 [Ficus carica]|uniref:Auxin-responsive protein n=1 Tax=Ficus carica TaxID=3494 RepID=A0AA88ACK6_FICCA|nr:hypothetical protein TIFTF001_022455 [Ficus carica]